MVECIGVYLRVHSFGRIWIKIEHDSQRVTMIKSCKIHKFYIPIFESWNFKFFEANILHFKLPFIRTGNVREVTYIILRNKSLKRRFKRKQKSVIRVEWMVTTENDNWKIVGIKGCSLTSRRIFFESTHVRIHTLEKEDSFCRRIRIFSQLCQDEERVSNKVTAI